MDDCLRLALIDALYDSVGTDEGWVTFVEQLRTSLHGSTVNLIRHDLENRRGNMLVSSGADPVGMTAYLEHWSQFDPWAYSPRQRGVSTQPVILGEELIAHSDLQRTSFYNDFARHYDLTRMIGATVEAGARTSCVLSISRGDHQQPFGVRQVQFLETLIPHIRQAIGLHQRLSGAERAAPDRLQAVNASTVALLFVNARGGITVANDAGQQLLARQDGMRTERGELRIDDPSAMQRVRVAIQDAMQLRQPVSRTVVVPRASGRRALLLRVYPVRHPEEWPAPERSVALVEVRDPEERQQPDAELLRTLYGLTPGEVALGMLLAQGLSVKAAAERLLLSRETIRSRLKVLLEKTRTHRQPDLVRLLLRTQGMRTEVNRHSIVRR